jgi:hypothetical protein
MANPPPVRTSTRSWDAEVKAADKTKEDKTAYRFSNNRKFKDRRNPYE